MGVDKKKMQGPVTESLRLPQWQDLNTKATGFFPTSLTKISSTDGHSNDSSMCMLMGRQGQVSKLVAREMSGESAFL